MATMSEPQNLKQEHKIVSQEEWLAARKELLKKEKEATRLLDQLSAERRKLPWVKVKKNYVFDAPGGKVKLADLFAGRSQLVVQHFMFGPDWQEGCPSCSFMADHIDGYAPAPGRARRHDGGGLAGAAGQNRGVQKTHGLALQLGVVLRRRFQH